MPVSDILLSTRYELYPEVLIDTFFTKTAVLSRFRERTELWGGGAYMSDIFRHSPMIASNYAIGGTHTIIKRQTTDEQKFEMKYYNTMIPEFLEVLEVLNTNGPLQVYSLLDEDISNGLDTIETFLAISFWGGGTTNTNAVNGFDEALGHATLPSWNGVIASSYGQASRSTYTDLNSNVLWFGSATGGTGPVSFKKLNNAYIQAEWGEEQVDTIVMNKSLRGAIEDKMQAQQIMLDYVTDPYWGGSGFRLKKAMVLVDEYCPSLADGKTNAQTKGLGSYLTGTITGPAAATPPGNFPGSSATLTVGEVIFGLNMNYWAFRLSDSATFQFGLSDFMRTPDSHKLAAEINVACNLQCFAGSKYQFQAYGASA